MKKLFEYKEPEDKDILRINDIISKSHGDESKAEKFALNMAKSIKDSAKMERRYYAASLLLGTEHPVTEAFRKGLESFNIVPDDMTSNSALKKEGFALVTQKPKTRSISKINKESSYKDLKRTGAKYLVLYLNKLSPGWSEKDKKDIDKLTFMCSEKNGITYSRIVIDVENDIIVDRKNNPAPVKVTCNLFCKISDELSTRVVTIQGKVLFETGIFCDKGWEYVPRYVPGEEDGDYINLIIKNGKLQNI